MPRSVVLVYALACATVTAFACENSAGHFFFRWGCTVTVTTFDEVTL